MYKRLLSLTVLSGALLWTGCAESEDDVPEDPIIAEEAAAPAVGAGVAEGIGFEQWDADRDQRLAVNEFGTWAGGQGLYDRWDTDAETGISDAEFGAGAMSIWDTDDDSRITDTEWTAGAGNWFGEADAYGTFADWDANRDTFLDAGELGEGFERTGLFGQWDANDSALLEENEWNEGVFGIWDENDDRFLDTNEWNTGVGDWGVV